MLVKINSSVLTGISVPSPMNINFKEWSIYKKQQVQSNQKPKKNAN